MPGKPDRRPTRSVIDTGLGEADRRRGARTGAMIVETYTKLYRIVLSA
jgi:hypothetical protein